MIGIKVKDIDKDLLMVFAICYEYSLSFTHVLKLFNISRKYFWVFMEFCSPMIKMGVRKASNLKKSVDRIFPYLTDFECTRTTLTPYEDKILESFTWFMEDSFTDGDGCLHISQFKSIPFAKACSDKGLLVASNYEEMTKNLDRISYIQMGDTKFYKTSRFLFYMEKYSGDVGVQELDSMSVKKMLKRIQEGIEKEQQEEAEYGETHQCTT